MGLPIYFEAPTLNPVPKTKTDPTAYSRSIIRRPATRERRHRAFNDEATDSAARAFTNERQPSHSSLRRTRSTYGVDEALAEMSSVRRVRIPSWEEDLSEQRPRSRRGPTTASATVEAQRAGIEEDMFPALRRVAGRVRLRDATTRVNGLGDRDRSLSPGPLEWNTQNPFGYQDSAFVFTQSPVPSSRLPPPPPASLPIALQLSAASTPPGFGTESPPQSPPLLTTADADSLFCDDPDGVPTSNIRGGEPEPQHSSQPPVALFREARRLILELEERLNMLTGDDIHNDEVLSITHQLEGLAGQLRDQEARLRSSLRHMREERVRRYGEGPVADWELGRL